MQVMTQHGLRFYGNDHLGQAPNLRLRGRHFRAKPIFPGKRGSGDDGDDSFVDIGPTGPGPLPNNCKALSGGLLQIFKIGEGNINCVDARDVAQKIVANNLGEADLMAYAKGVLDGSKKCQSTVATPGGLGNVMRKITDSLERLNCGQAETGSGDIGQWLKDNWMIVAGVVVLFMLTRKRR